MALAEKHVIMFQKECSNLSNIVLINLHVLKENPKDSDVMKKIIQAADTMIGDSRFINNKELEKASVLLVKTFNCTENVIEKSKIEFFIDMFTKLKKN